MSSFGIYILTYPGDFHLALPLIRSIQYYHADVPIMIIPGEGFDRKEHPFDVQIMPDPSGFWSILGHQDRDFLAFHGPFEKFLYLDADVICTKPIHSLIKRIHAQQNNFIFVNIPRDTEDWSSAIHDQTHPNHLDYMLLVRKQLGNPENLSKFDPDYNYLNRRPFNSGVFASRRHAISEADMAKLHKDEKIFYQQVLKKTFSWKADDLFYRDQGRLNYLVDKLRIPILNLYPDGYPIWAGMANVVTLRNIQMGTCPFHFIHWAGVPRPSSSFFSTSPLFWLLAKTQPTNNYKRLSEIPGYSVWRYFYEQSKGPITLRERITWSFKDLKLITKLFVRRLVTRRQMKDMKDRLVTRLNLSR